MATTVGSASSTSRPPRRTRASPGSRSSAAARFPTTRAPAPRPPHAPPDRHHRRRTRMSRIAFIGLGIMGSPMSVHLQNAGHDVVGFNLTPDRTADLIAAGGTSAGSIAEAVSDVDVVAVMVPDSPDVQDVLTGEDGVFASAKPGTLIIDFSSIRPDVSAALADQATAHGFPILDAPVSGGEAGAKNAALSIMVGGTQDVFDTARPILDAVGKTVVLVGPHGAGQTVKAANQLIVATNIQAVAEAVVFLEAYGVDMEASLEVLGGGLAGSAVLNQKKQNMLTRTFDPGFRIDLHHKDMGIVTSAAREAGVVLPVGAVMAQLMASARANGDGGLDHSGLLRGVERLSGADLT
ncbi:2-hydroxy-3-oxopropionate reductase [Knoellia sp. CPCC 206453]|uniref:2-hydroxy-3-oxopropionate reductase n=1 Tax=Knoellia pratensis TaxID=3404796 RepID=UPI003615D4D5